MKRALLPIVLVLAAAAGYFALRDEPAAPRQEATASGAARPAPRPTTSTASTGASAPATPVAARALPLPAQPKVPPPTLFGEYLKARSYRAMYDRLNGTAEGMAPEGRLVLYEILRQCAAVTEGMRPGFRPNITKREDFLAGIPAGDPKREKRIAAYEEFTLDRCAGFEGVSITRADLMKLLTDAANAGDPRARALSMEQELWQARRSGGRDAVTLTDAQVDQLRQIIGTKDPEAIRVGGRILANGWSDYALRMGPDEQPVEPRPFMNAFLMLSCEYGAPCGEDSPRMLQACAFQGHCDARTYPEYLHYYGSTPHDSETLQRYQAFIRQAIETGDWSQIRVVRGQPTGPRMTFVPGPR